MTKAVRRSAALALTCAVLSFAGGERASWMKARKWGVMTHFLADWQAQAHQLDMSVDEWNKLIDNFDVEAIAEQLHQAGASWYQISIGQNSGYYLSPNP